MRDIKHIIAHTCKCEVCGQEFKESTIPKGWKLVPIEATEEMKQAGEQLEYFEGGCGSEAYEFWNEMIRVSPEYKP